jgi:pyruvate,water dikinase
MSAAWVVDLAAPAAAGLEQVGGKALGLHALLAAGLPAPPGFCVTAAAFRAATAGDAALAATLAALDAAPVDDLDELRRLAAALRSRVAAMPLPDGLAAAIAAAVRAHGEHAYAVRSSATAEDLDDASFAGLQDTFLQVRGADAVTGRVRGCWASLFTDRAVAYRRRREIPGASAAMAVVVQRMVDADAAGVIFSADPTTGHRGVAVIEAVWGLGDALVSGRALADVVRVRRADGAVIERRTADKRARVVGRAEGGTREEAVPEDRRQAPVLADAEARALAELAGRAEALRGGPQDVEWARADGRLWLLQSRAITTLFPRPAVADGRRHVLVSFGHIQVNTAPLSPLGISAVRRLLPFRRVDGVSQQVQAVGGRLYIDVTPALQRAPLRFMVPALLTKMHRPSAERVALLAARPDVIAAARATRPAVAAMLRFLGPVLLRALRRSLLAPERLHREYAGRYAALVARHVARVRAAPDAAGRLRALEGELAVEFDHLLRRGAGPLIATVFVGESLLRRLCARVCPDAAPDALLRGLEGNITTEMDLELGDLADVAREVPALVAALRGEAPAEALSRLRGDAAAAGFFAGWDAFLGRWGARAAGEIDVGVPRWRERPDALLRALAGLLDRPTGAHRAQHEAARREAERVAAEIERAARRGPLGWLRGPVIRGLIGRVRAAHALREHHKFALVELLGLLHDAALEVGAMLVADGAAARADEVFLLDLRDVRAAAEAHARGASLAGYAPRIAEARRVEARHRGLTPPAVMTDEGESPPLPAPSGAPPGALVGTAVSSGVIEARARVISDPARETLEAGEVLVAPFTDPGWTPLFMHASALVMEVGGLMTHGSVVARELGIPAVVAVEGATRELRSGQRVRVDGDRGWVTPLPEEP